MKTIVDIPDEVIESLAIVCEKENRSRASLIREALDEYLAKKGDDLTKEAFGLWKNKQKEGLACQENLRSEWD